MKFRTIYLPLVLNLALIPLSSCGDSSGDGLGGEFDIASLSDAVLRLCSTAECGDYSQSECELYLRYDALYYARLSEEPDRCFDAILAEARCLADAQDCFEPSCDTSDDACVFVSEPPQVRVPDVVRPTDQTCEFRANCYVADPASVQWQWTFAECQVEYVSRAEIAWLDGGPDCANSFIDLIACIGGAGLPCSPGGDEEKAACPTEFERVAADCVSD